MDDSVLRSEQEFTARVQQVLLAAIAGKRESGEQSIATIKAMLADAWEELRLKPTALSEQDMQQLAGEVDRYLARKAFTDDMSSRYERMLMEPFFGRIDFCEDGHSADEKTVIGLYSVPAPGGEILVHDWRAPICSLYYDEEPGEVSYESPSGTISGKLTLKRQYKMKDGKLEYYVNTSMSIDDKVLLDILSGATQKHIRQIVSTIQAEQNRAIRMGNEKLLSVVGGAGSGKTSVAMHRAAFLMYRYRNHLDAKHIVILSPSNSFSEYISNVLPELGEENTVSLTMYKLLTSILPSFKIEAPLTQNEILLDAASTFRRESVRYKSGTEFLDLIRDYCRSFSETGPVFSDLILNGKTLITGSNLTDMYTHEFAHMPPALRMERIRNVIESRLEKLESRLIDEYTEQLRGKYSGTDLKNAARFNAAHEFSGVRRQMRAAFDVRPLYMYARALESAPSEIARQARLNAEAGLIWWEDAPAVALIQLLLGFAQPDKTIRHLIADEAQDYTACALAMLNAYYPLTHVTLLGDPKQRTCPGQPQLDVSM